MWPAAARPRCRTRSWAARRTTACGPAPASGPRANSTARGRCSRRLNNQGGAGIEITPGPKWLTIRSDNNDKYAQPDGAWIGAKGTPTHVSFAGPELKGAQNVVIAGIDHRETAFGPQAFAAMWRFLTGSEPPPRAVPEARITRWPACSAAQRWTTCRWPAPPSRSTPPISPPAHRLGAALHRQTVGADGRWGRFITTSKTALEFVVTAPGHAITHVHRAPFARSSNWCSCAARIAVDDRDAPAVVTLTRPRGLLRHPARRDRARRPQPAGRHSRRRGRRVHGQGPPADAAKRRGRRLQRRTRRRPQLADGGQPRGVSRTVRLKKRRPRSPRCSSRRASARAASARESQAAGFVSLAGEGLRRPLARGRPEGLEFRRAGPARWPTARRRW